jgi:hypothetical protein
MLTIDRAAAIVLYGGDMPSGVSLPRWRACVKHLVREYLTRKEEPNDENHHAEDCQGIS